MYKTKILKVLCFILISALVQSFTSLSCAEDRSQQLDFEDELIEGMNKKPYDHLSQIGQKKKNKEDDHLYWKRAHFHLETNETLQELRYIQ